MVLAALPARADEPFYSELERLDEKVWFLGNFTMKNPAFRTAWKRQQIDRTDEGALRLSVAPAPEAAEKDFWGAEVQYKMRSHYGRYEVVMTAARGNGVISSFFTYTGPHFDDPHDEIDFEFLGRDTTKVWVTRFADGARLPGRWVDLPFDAADAPHLYAFEWLPDRIVWYVDNKEIFRVTEAQTTLPVTPGRIHMSIWGGGEAQRDWSGVASDDTRTAATYECVSYVPMGQKARQCSDSYAPANE
ncbi:family 16 glycosylhydrolase [Sulfitobacter aestuarii]|uniref:Beta-glucanase n=1 Tax=Sulfitobacter aestuarii TaxID=2161676 RepID=A0ABW5U3L5_9RHOB